ncbi:unnamed protein product, partial [Symbiodinium sp. CCMP2456]
ALSLVKLGATPIRFQDLLCCKEIQASSSFIAMEVLLLCLAIRRNKQLRRVDFSEVSANLTVDTVKDLVDSLRQLRGSGCPALDEVCFKGVNLFPRDMEDGSGDVLDLNGPKVVMDRSFLAPLLVFVLEKGRFLKSLDFRNNEFGHETEHIIDAVLTLEREGRLTTYNGVPIHGVAKEEFSLEKEPVMPHGICVFASTYLARSS